jgi:hypothetical protein
VWYRLDATDDLNVTLSTAGSEFDTVLSVWTGGPAHPLGELACNDNVGGAGTTASELSFSAVAGRTYYVQVVGVAWAGGDLTFGSRAATLGSTTWTIYLNHLLTRRR